MRLRFVVSCLASIVAVLIVCNVAHAMHGAKPEGVVERANPRRSSPHVLLPPDTWSHMQRVATHHAAQLRALRRHDQNVAAKLRVLVPDSETMDDLICTSNLTIASDHNVGALRFVSQYAMGENTPLQLADVEGAGDAEACITRRMCGDSAQLATAAHSYSDAHSLFVHLHRDWSQEGAPERARTHAALLSRLESLFPSHENRTGIRVLVPGAGAGRLAHDIAALGFATTAVDVSCTLATAAASMFSAGCDSANNVVELATVESGAAESRGAGVGNVTVCPFLDVTSNLRSCRSRVRCSHVPDTLPTCPSSLVYRVSSLEEMRRFVQEGCEAPFDVVVTLFFFDVPRDPLATAASIGQLLQTNGLWLNLGPLQYHTSILPKEDQSDMPSSPPAVHLTAEQVALLLMSSVFDNAGGPGWDVQTVEELECTYFPQPGRSMAQHGDTVCMFWEVRWTDGGSPHRASVGAK